MGIWDQLESTENDDGAKDEGSGEGFKGVTEQRYSNRPNVLTSQIPSSDPTDLCTAGAVGPNDFRN